LPERRPELAFDGVLGQEAETDWRDELDQVLSDGNVFFRESLLFHRASGTLLAGDFVENVRAETGRGALAWVLRLFTEERPMPSPEFRYYTQDARALRRSLERALAWPIERIFLCHGELIEDGAREVFVGVVAELEGIVERRGAVSAAAFRALARLQ
jgi:hypothetical protein